MPRTIDRLFNIEPGEGRLVALLFFQYFCTGIASVLTQTAAFAVFLSAFAADTLPYAYVVMAVALSSLTLMNFRIGRHLGFSGQLRLNLTTQIAITLLFAIGLTLARADWMIFLLPVLFQLAVVYGNMTFWSLAGRLLDVRQGKRLFGLVGSGEWMAIVILGFLMPLIVPVVGLVNLLWLALLGATGALVLLNITLRTFASRLQELSPAAAGVQSPTSTGSMFRQPYIVVVLALTLIWWVGFFFFDNIFYEQSARQFPDSEALAAFIGVYLGMLGILTLLTSSLLTGRILGLLGLRGSLVVLPVGLLVGAAIMVGGIALDGSLLILFLAAVASRMWGIWIGFSADQAARSILYQPLAPGLRTRVQSTADGIVQPVAIGVAGIALLVLGALFPGSTTPLVVGALALAAALLFTVLLAGRGYVRMLVEALDQRRLRPVGSPLDRTSLEVLKRGLGDQRPGPVLYCMRMLEEVSPDTLDREVAKLLRHSSPPVRLRALERVAGQGIGAWKADVLALSASDTSPQVRGMACETLGALGDIEVLRPALSSDELSVRSGAILGLALASGGRATPEVLAALDTLAASPDSPARYEAARIAGRLPASEPGVARVVGALLDDPVPGVRRSAMLAAANSGDAGLLGKVIQRLDSRSTRPAALSALASAGEAAIEAIAASLQHGSSQPMKLSLLRGLGAIGSQAAQRLLVPYVDSTRHAERDAALRALVASRFRLSREEAPRGAAWLEAEAQHGNWLAQAWRDIGDDPGFLLVRAALSEQLEGCRERLFMLLGFMADADAVQRVREGLGSADPRRVAYSRELLDMQVPTTLRSVVLPLLEGGRIDLEGGQVGMRRETLEQLADALEIRASEWTKACARHALLASMDSPAEMKADPGGRSIMELIEKVLVLRTVGIFDATRDEVLAEVASICEVIDAPMGTGIVEQGSMGDTMYAVASGRVRVHQEAGTLNELVAGEVFGEMALLDPEPRSASVTAIVDTRLLRFDQQALFELIEAHPEVARGMLQVLTRRLRQAINRETQEA